MRKLKVIKKWPSGPEIGTELLNKGIDDSVFYHPGGIKSWVEHELEGFVEEVKDSVGYWYMSTAGIINFANQSDTYVPKWYRFNTKQSAEKFQEYLKETHGDNPGHISKFLEAIGDRVTQ